MRWTASALCPSGGRGKLCPPNWTRSAHGRRELAERWARIVRLVNHAVVYILDQCRDTSAHRARLLNPLAQYDISYVRVDMLMAGIVRDMSSGRSHLARRRCPL